MNIIDNLLEEKFKNYNFLLDDFHSTLNTFIPNSSLIISGGFNMPISNENIIVADDLTISYDLHRERKKLIALQDINLEIKKGEFVVLVGPSGCGKTSFINAVSGLIPKSGGSVKVRGEEVTAPGPDRAMVFQDYALLPWRTVESNIRLPYELQNLGISEEEKKQRVKNCLN